MSQGKFGAVVTYTVHEPAEPEADRLDRADQLQFVKDGFSWLTALCPPLGLAAQSLWIPAALYLLIAWAIAALIGSAGIDAAWTMLIVFALNVFLGFEVSTLKRWMLDRQGWQMLGSVNGSSLVECERRFLESWLPSQPIIRGPASSGGSSGSSSGSSAGTGGAGPFSVRRPSWPFGARA